MGSDYADQNHSLCWLINDNIVPFEYCNIFNTSQVLTARRVATSSDIQYQHYSDSDGKPAKMSVSSSNPKGYSHRDDRDDLALRSLNICVGDCGEGDGSARWSQGTTSVTTSVYLLPSSQAAYSGTDDFDKATLMVEVTCPSAAISPGSSNNSQRKKEKSLSSTVSKVLESVMDLRSFPNQTVFMKILVITDGGSLSAATVNCAILAILNTGIPMRFTPVAVALSLWADERTLLDPTLEEENLSECNFLYVCGHMASEKQPKEVYALCEGSCELDRLEQAAQTAVTASTILVDCIRAAISAGCKI